MPASSPVVAWSASPAAIGHTLSLVATYHVVRPIPCRTSRAAGYVGHGLDKPLKQRSGGSTNDELRRRQVFAVLLASTAACQRSAAQAGVSAGRRPRPPNGTSQVPAFAGQTDAPERKLGVAFDVVTVAEGLETPWSVAFLPNGKMLVTERPGRLRIVSADGSKSEPVDGPAAGRRARAGWPARRCARPGLRHERR